MTENFVVINEIIHESYLNSHKINLHIKKK